MDLAFLYRQMARKPVSEGRDTFGRVFSAAVSREGGGLRDRAGGMTRMMSVMARARRVPLRQGKGDPMTVARKALRKFPEEWLEFLGRGGRTTVAFDVPADGGRGEVPPPPHCVDFGKAAVRRTGDDVTVISVAVGVHRALEAAKRLEAEGISCEVIDLRSLRPLDSRTVIESVKKTGCMLVVDEDYREFGLSGELAAVCLEAGIAPRFRRVCVDDTLPFARHLEDAALPNVDRIFTAVTALINSAEN